MNFSVVIVSFKSFHLVEKHIQEIGEKQQIIVIENSLDNTLKDKLEKLHPNVEVVIPNKNLGYGAALNLGIKISKNNFVFCMAADLKIRKNCFINLSNIVNNFNQFAILAPTYIDETIYKNYIIHNDKILNKEDKVISNFTLKEVDEIDGAFLAINKEKFNSPYIMDENIFLYFENIDLCFRLRKNNEKLYVVNDLKFEHFGSQSSHPDFKKQITICRNWHYCWSKFYFYRKHYSYYKAIRKTIPNLVRSVKSCIYYKFKKDSFNYEIHKSELSGLLSAYLLKKSYYRPNIK